jgi:hypothetical protein
LPHLRLLFVDPCHPLFLPHGAIRIVQCFVPIAFVRVLLLSFYIFYAHNYYNTSSKLLNKWFFSNRVSMRLYCRDKFSIVIMLASPNRNTNTQ